MTDSKPNNEEELSEFDKLKLELEQSAEELRDEAKDLELRMMRETVAAQRAHGAGDVKAILGRRGYVIVKTPKQPTFRKFSDVDNHSSEDLIALIKPCLVTDRTAFEKLLDVEPGILVPVAGACLELAGIKSADFLAKLKG